MDAENLAYLNRRIEQERARADVARAPEAAAVHRQLAEEYRRRLPTDTDIDRRY